MAFIKGQSGNPGGELAGKHKLLRERLLPHVDKAIAALVYALETRDAVRAATEILDRVYGKTPQAITGLDGGAIKFEMIDRPVPVQKTQWIVEYDLRNQSNQLDQSNQLETPSLTQDPPRSLVRS